MRSVVTSNQYGITGREAPGLVEREGERSSLDVLAESDMPANESTGRNDQNVSVASTTKSRILEETVRLQAEFVTDQLIHFLNEDDVDLEYLIQIIEENRHRLEQLETLVENTEAEE